MKNIVRNLCLILIVFVLYGRGYAAFNRTDYELQNAVEWSKIDRVVSALEKGPTRKGLNDALRSVFRPRTGSRRIETVYQMIDLLVSRGADINQKDKYGHPLLLDIVRINNPALLDYVLKKGGNANGYQFIHKASFEGLKNNIRVLLEHGAKADVRSGSGTTPLHSAAVKGLSTNIQAALFLLEKGAPVNAADNDGWTPLMFTTRNGHYNFAKMLLEKGADPNMKTKKGATALSMAKAYNLWLRGKKDSHSRNTAEKYRKLMQLLTTHGAKEGTRYSIPGGR